MITYVRDYQNHLRKPQTLLTTACSRIKQDSERHLMSTSITVIPSKLHSALFSPGRAGTPPELKREVRALEKVSQRLCKTDCSALFNSVCVNDWLLYHHSTERFIPHNAFCRMTLVLPNYSNNNKSHTDIDECGKDNGGCSQVCIETKGSFECQCEVGYLLDSDKRTCKGNLCSFSALDYFYPSAAIDSVNYSFKNLMCTILPQYLLR